jgi:hypothetical protein
MEIGSEFFSSTKIAEPRALPRPKLLIELEPAYRVFFANLLDTLLFRPVPQVTTTSRPGKFWPDVFVQSEMPWWGFLESMLWHMLAAAGLWSISQGVALRSQPFQRPMPRRTYISYYRPSPTYPVAGARLPQPPPPARNGSSSQRALKVAREGRRGGEGAAPDLKLGRGGAPNLPGAGASLPEMPFSATRRSRLNVPAGPNALVAPPPEVYQITGRRGGLPQAAVVAPPPDVAGVASRRGLGAPGSAVVEPPPSVQGALRKLSDVNIAHAEVVAPAPRLPMHEQRAGVGVDQAGLGGSSDSVVPPPPSVQRSGTLRGGRIGSMAGGGSQVVPPPPAIQEAAGVGRPGGLPSAVQVVPPPPSVEGIGNSAGRGRGTAVAGNGFGVVPPAPSTREVGNSAGAGRSSSLSGTGVQVVPPPPSMQGVGGGGGRGRGTALSGGGIDVVPPAPSAHGVSGSLGGGRGGSLGGTGSQASGPTGAGSGEGNARGGLAGSSGKGSSSGSGSEVASASGIAGKGSGSGGHGIGSGGGTSPGGGAGAGTSGNVGSGGGSGSGGRGVAAGEGGSGGHGSTSPGGGNASGGGNSPAAAGLGSGVGAGSAAGSANGSNAGAGNPGGGGRSLGADIPSARPPILDNPPGPTDLPVRVIGLAMALPSSSYFSNYEVFIAERRISKDESQLIKLVYVSLPYQRRLSEYGLNNRVFKLRAIRDPSCDESLMQMTWPDADQSKPGTAAAADPPELKSGRNDKLPCYRTTADDYRKAVSRRR